MSRPFSPSSSSSAGEPSTASAASRRLCRSLLVDAQAHDAGVHSRLYCKLILPTSSPSSRVASNSSARFHLLNLTPHSRLVGHTVHPLPLQPGDAEDAVQAARMLGLTAAEGGEGTIGRRRSLSLARMAERSELKIERDGQEVVVVLLPSPSADEEDEAGSPATARAPSRAGTLSPTPSSIGAGERNVSAEFIVVLDVQTTFGVLKLPSFANAITVPTPLCLRNTLSFTLPAPPSSSTASSWDLSVRPSLTNASSTSITSLSSSESTQISGTFPSSPRVFIRWAPQLPPEVAAPLVIPRAALDVRWTISESGAGQADVNVQGTFECAALREKQWVEVEVGMGRQEGEGPFQLSDCEGEDDTPVLAWETAGTPSSSSPATLPLPPPPSLAELDSFTSPLDDSLLLSRASTSSSSSSSSTRTEYPFTPTPASRRRPSNPRASEPRPPSFTSLFDTAPPVALGAGPLRGEEEVSLLEVQLPPEETGRERASRQKGSESSELMGQEAPFDPEGSALDMSFEVARSSEAGETEGADEEEEPELLPPLSPARPSSRIRVQLDLAPALRQVAHFPPSSPVRPSFSFTLHLAFPAFSLSTSSHSTSRNCHSLPTFALLAAIKEEAVVTVFAPAPRAGPARRVELLPTTVPHYQDSANPSFALDSEGPPPSPLPGVGGRARWAAVRGNDEWTASPRTRKVSAPVEVEIVAVDDGEQGDWTTLAESAEIAPQNEPDEVEKAEPPAPLPLSASFPADDLELPPPPTSTSNSSFVTSSRESSSSPDEAAVIPLVQVSITPLPPHPSSHGQSWRFFHRVTFAHPYRRSFRISVPPASEVDVVDGWAEGGESVRLETELASEVDSGDRRALQVAVERRNGVKEVMYLERRRVEEDDEVSMGTALPRFGDKVARLDVEVAVPQGSSSPFSSESPSKRPPAAYHLEATQHSFDLVSSSSSSTTFTRFLVPPRSRSELGVTARSNGSDPSGSVPVVAKIGAAPAATSPRPWNVLLQPFLLFICALFGWRVSSTNFFTPAPSSVPGHALPSLSPITASYTFFSTVTSIETAFHTQTYTTTASATRTTTTTMTETATVTSLVVSTTTHSHTSISTITSTQTVSSPSASTFSAVSCLSPSPPSPFSSSFSFTEDFPAASPAPPFSLSPAQGAPQYVALDLEDTARSVIEAVRTWVRRVSWKARGFWTEWTWWTR
ncbi:hypothetical protein JCM11251_002568 [Rhodosporidiobolus azoricus]